MTSSVAWDLGFNPTSYISNIFTILRSSSVAPTTPTRWRSGKGNPKRHASFSRKLAATSTHPLPSLRGWQKRKDGPCTIWVRKLWRSASKILAQPSMMKGMLRPNSARIVGKAAQDTLQVRPVDGSIGKRVSYVKHGSFERALQTSQLSIDRMYLFCSVWAVEAGWIPWC